MRFTSWGPTKAHGTELFSEDGPRILAVFHEDSAQVGGDTWQLTSDKDSATATLPDGRVFRATGLHRGATVTVDLAGRHFTFTKEKRSDWIIEDSVGHKVAQFSGANQGVRRSITEFDAENAEDAEARTLNSDEIVALSWFVRRVLLSGLGRYTMATIATLILMTLVALVAFL